METAEKWGGWNNFSLFTLKLPDIFSVIKLRTIVKKYNYVSITVEVVSNIVPQPLKINIAKQ